MTVCSACIFEMLRVYLINMGWSCKQRRRYLCFPTKEYERYPARSHSYAPVPTSITLANATRVILLKQGSLPQPPKGMLGRKTRNIPNLGLGLTPDVPGSWYIQQVH